MCVRSLCPRRRAREEGHGLFLSDEFGVLRKIVKNLQRRIVPIDYPPEKSHVHDFLVLIVYWQKYNKMYEMRYFSISGAHHFLKAMNVFH